MSAALTPVVHERLLPDAATVDRLNRYVEDSKSPATWRAYRSAWRDFAAWCDARGVASLPADPQTLALYLDEQAERGYAVAYIAKKLAAISQAHKAAGHTTPTEAAPVKLVWSGIRRRLGTAQRQVTPAVTETIRAMVAGLDDGPAGRRDRALLLIGFAAALRRSELVALDVADVREVTDGLKVTLRRSKTDQEGAGETKGVPFGSNPATCPVRAWRGWLEVSGVTEGPAFRAVDQVGRIADRRMHHSSVASIVKRAVARAGLDPAEFSGHSLRAGLATAAAMAGVPERSIMAQTGHKSLPVLRRYIRDGSLFRENAAAAVGL